jgi:hypothetical protein
MSQDWFCTQCGTVGQPKKITKGSFGMELLMWLLMILPGVLYSLWRITSRYKGCPNCGAAHMIPATSPVAVERLATLSASRTAGHRAT